MHPQPFSRNTQQRRIILEELQKLTSHPTAGQLCAVVRRRLPHISLGTVYRNLDLLARAGLVHKLDFSDAETRFDGDVRPHDHLRCVRCGRVDDLPGVPLELPAQPSNDLRGYELLGHRLELVGICPQCREHPSAPENPNTRKPEENETC